MIGREELSLAATLHYADDTTLVAAKEDQLINYRRVEETSNKSDLLINRKKTKIMIIGRQNNKTPEVKRINNSETVESLIYFGTTISNKIPRRNKEENLNSLKIHDQTN